MARRKKKRLRIEKGWGKKKRKPGNAAERARRRRKIRKKLEGKLRESAGKRKAKEARSGSFLKVREVETIDGKERIAPFEIIERGGFSPEQFRPQAEPFEPGEFFLVLDPAEIALIEKSWKKKERDIEARLRALIQKEGDMQHTATRLRSIEEQLVELMQAYDLTWHGVSQSIEKAVQRMAVEVEVLLDLTELERKVKKELLYKPGQSEKGVPNFDRQRERVKEIAEHLKVHEAAFDISRVYAFIALKGKADLNEAVGRLEMEEERVKACAELLEARKLIETRRFGPGRIELKLAENPKSAAGKAGGKARGKKAIGKRKAGGKRKKKAGKPKRKTGKRKGEPKRKAGKQKAKGKTGKRRK